VENHWLWKWKFRYFDRQVRFDPTKAGWPWVDGTISWVAPTALTLLAFHAWKRESPRLAAGVEMLRDRACSQGGWNAGNSVVFGVHLDPHPDFTAMALLGLRPFSPALDSVASKALDYLVRRFEFSASPYSLAWAIMALAAYGRTEAPSFSSRLGQMLQPNVIDRLPARVLALAALALDNPVFTFQENRA
jgi:hypothetical protein